MYTAVSRGSITMMKIWLIAVLVVLAFIAVDITVRIGWARLISGIGSLVDGQRHVEHLTKQSADIKNTPTYRGQTPEQPTQPLPEALPRRGDTASRQGSQDKIDDISNLPPEWGGDCRLQGEEPSCAVWKVGPDDTVVMITYWLKGGISVSFRLPGKPSAVRVLIDGPASTGMPRGQSVWRILPTRLSGTEAFFLIIDLRIALRLFIEVETPSPHLVAFPLDGIGAAVDRLNEVREAAIKKGNRKP